MKTALSRLFLPVILMAFTFGCATAPAVNRAAAVDNPAVITDITVQGDTLAISCSRNFVYTIYSSNDPYRMTIEIPDMHLGNFKDKIAFDNARITEVIPQQIDSPHPSVKLDIMLQTPSSTVPQYQNNTLTLLMANEQPVASSETKADKSKTEEPAADRAAAMSEQPLALGETKAEKVEVQELPAGKAPASLDSRDTVAEKDATAVQANEGGQKTAAGIPEQATSGEAQKGKPVSLQKATEITGIELQKTDGAVDVVITGNGAMTPNVFPLDGRIVIDIPSVLLKASIPENVIRPITGIRAGKHKDRVRLVLDLRKKTHYEVSSKGALVVIALQKEGSTKSPSAMGTVESPTPPAVTPEPSEEKVALQKAPVKQAETGEPPVKEITSVPEADKVAGKYAGKKISLDFQDAEIGPIFRLLADVNGYNLVLDPSVKGKITIKLMNVPWDQALDIILNTFNLSKSVEGNILWIAPSGVFAKILDDKTKEKEAAEKAEPLMQEIIRVNYASAGDISGAITQGKLLSPRGSITMDQRMNTLIIKDTAQSIAKVRDLVKIMDVSKPQVMIEARLVQVSTDYSKSLGITWGGNFTSPTWPTSTSGSFSVNTPSGSTGTTPASGPGGTANMTVGYANTFAVNLSLSALETIGKSRTLANPRVLTMDNEGATIQQGQTFFIPTVSQAGTQTQQQQATLSLNVTPKITPDGYVQLKVVATNNTLEPGTAGANAVVDTQSLTTQALVKNGETLVLGGIYTKAETESETGVPLLGKVPFLGWLFKTKSWTGPTARELLIFITPKIIGTSS